MLRQRDGFSRRQAELALTEVQWASPEAALDILDLLGRGDCTVDNASVGWGLLVLLIDSLPPPLCLGPWPAVGRKPLNNTLISPYSNLRSIDSRSRNSGFVAFLDAPSTRC